MEYVIAHHDQGWEAIDAEPKLDPNTGLPYHLGQTPLDLMKVTNQGSPDFNQQEHPFAGLISSMHTRGFYNGRYGLLETTYRDVYPPELHPVYEQILNSEEERQNRLKAELRANPDTEHWADEDFYMPAYNLLQFFDLLALYFHLTHPSQHTETSFQQVPVQPGESTTITLKPLTSGIYSLSPYPFALKEVEVITEGRYLMPLREGDTVNMTEYLYSQPIASQIYRLVPAEGAETYISIT
jgi:hypothetical protein